MRTGQGDQRGRMSVQPDTPDGTEFEGEDILGGVIVGYRRLGQGVHDSQEGKRRKRPGLSI